MKCLGIDYGSRRIGLAVSDDDGRVAFPRTVIRSGPRAFEEILEMAKKENADRVVIGESKNLDMTDNPIMEGVRTLRTRLEKAGIRVDLHPEHYSSAQVLSTMGEENKSIDASAAAIILQNYLDLHNK